MTGEPKVNCVQVVGRQMNGEPVADTERHFFSVTVRLLVATDRENAHDAMGIALGKLRTVGLVTVPNSTIDARVIPPRKARAKRVPFPAPLVR